MIPTDIAHDLFESGVVNHSLALVFTYPIFHVKVFTLASFQKIMKSSSYARADRVNTHSVVQTGGRKVHIRGTSVSAGPS